MDKIEKEKKMIEYQKKIIAWAKKATKCVWCGHPVQWDKTFHSLKCDGCGLQVRDIWADTKINEEW